MHLVIKFHSLFNRVEARVFAQNVNLLNLRNNRVRGFEERANGRGLSRGGLTHEPTNRESYRPDANGI